MLVKKKDLLGFGIQLVLLVITVFVSTDISGSEKDIFIFWCRYGLLISIILFLFLWNQGKKLITGVNIFYVVFVLFQFGIPIIFAFNPNYYSYYLKLFEDSILISGAKYTVFAIQVFVLGIFLSGNVKRSNSSIKGTSLFSKTKAKINKNRKTVANAAFLLFIVCAILMVPINTYAAFMALKTMSLGLSIGASFRGIMSSNAVFRLVQQLFFPAGLLFLCFNDNKRKGRLVDCLYLIVVALMLIVADRSSGISALFVYVLFKYEQSDTEHQKSFGRLIYIVSAGILIVILAVVIAQVRTNGSAFSSNNFLFNMIEEMGFNFTSICFVQQYIPAIDSFKYGLSYLVAIVFLIPKTFDFLNIFPLLTIYLGETWLYNTNISIGRDYLSFGVGFSLSAESYYNFGYWGLICMFIWGIIIAVTLKSNTGQEDYWKSYTRYALMLAFLTLPRRQFSYMLNAVEYNILFIGLYVLMYIFLAKKRKA